MKVPAVYETEAGILFFCMFFTIAFTGRSTKYAFSPSGKIGSSMVWFPSLSGIRKSSRFIPTRSTEISNLPPACPIDKMTSGLCSSIAFSIFLIDFPFTVGISNLIICAPVILSGNFLTDSMAGFMGSPPKGSKPVTNIFIVFFV